MGGQSPPTLFVTITHFLFIWLACILPPPLPRRPPRRLLKRHLEIIPFRITHRLGDHLQGIIGSREQFFRLFHPGMPGEISKSDPELFFKDALQSVWVGTDLFRKRGKRIIKAQVSEDKFVNFFSDLLIGWNIRLQTVWVIPKTAADLQIIFTETVVAFIKMVEATYFFCFLLPLTIFSSVALDGIKSCGEHFISKARRFS